MMIFQVLVAVLLMSSALGSVLPDALDLTALTDFRLIKNDHENTIDTKRSIEDSVESFVKTNLIHFNLPFIGDLTVDSRKLDDDQIDLKLNFGSQDEERGKKHKLKKVFIPILTFILLKAITIVPFVIGLLALKAWNGLQLALFSFIISAGLAIFQLCQKLAANSHAPVILDHPPDRMKRSMDDNAQELAYSGYVQ